MVHDRAEIATRRVLAVLAQHGLHSRQFREAVAAVLRDEFLEIQQETLHTTRAEDPRE
jgi:hypothetical protein